MHITGRIRRRRPSSSAPKTSSSSSSTSSRELRDAAGRTSSSSCPPPTAAADPVDDGEALLAPPVPSWRDDVRALSLHATSCLLLAMLVSTYEDYDVTHTRPNPSTLRRRSTTTTTSNAAKDRRRGGSGSSFSSSSSSSSSSLVDFLGAATRGMGWGYIDRDVGGVGGGLGGLGGGGGIRDLEYDNDIDNDYNYDDDPSSFGGWYGTSAATLRWKPSYNEIMLRHRTERVPRWKDQEYARRSSPSSPSSSSSEEEESEEER